MPKQKRLSEIIDLEVYPFDVMVSFNESDKKFVKRLKRYGEDGQDLEMEGLRSASSKRGYAVMLPSNVTILRLNFYPRTPNDFGMLAHEIFHVCEFIMERIGAKVNKETSEPFAYLLQYVTEKVYDLIES